jgi:hypothetical protein
MDPQHTNDEQKMRDKMLRHEFPFDEKAWESMEILLDQDRQTGPPPPLPDSKPGPGKWGLAVVLVVALFAGLAIWWPTTKTTPGLNAAAEEDAAKSDQRTSDVPATIWKEGAPADETMDTTEQRKNEQGRVSTQNQQNQEYSLSENRPVAGSRGQQTAIIGTEKMPNASAALQDDTPEKGRARRTNQLLRRQGPDPGKTKIRETTPETAPSTQSLAQQGGGLDSGSKGIGEQQEVSFPVLTGMEANVGGAPGSEAGTTKGSGASSDPQSGENQNPLPVGAEAGSVLASIPALPIFALPLPCPADSLIRPVPDPARVKSRWERSWIFGAGANTVDYNPLRLNVLPHFGYLLRYRLHPKTALQAELVLKPVSDYGWRAEFLDIVPTGSSQVILENNNLLFFEVPIVVQHRYAPDQAWLVGLKPSWNVSVFPYGSFSVTNFNAPSRNYTAHSGIRSFDLGLVLGWEWRISRRWALDVRYNQGLFDLTIDNFYKSRDIHLNSDLQVSLRRFITKKMRRHVPDTNLYPTPAGR